MAVPSYKREQGELAAITKAKELVAYTIQVCNNEKRFPKRSRWILANRIVDSAMTIMEQCDVANNIYVSLPCDYELRRNAQTMALATTSKMLGQVEVAYNMYGSTAVNAEHWTGLVYEVRELIKAWRQSDKERYGGFA